MIDKRKFVRRHLLYYLQVFDRHTDNLIGHLVDITPQGLMLLSKTPIGLDVPFQMRMILPHEILGKEQITFEAVSRWSDKDVNPIFHDNGFKLLEMSDETRLIIDQLIEDLGFDDRT